MVVVWSNASDSLLSIGRIFVFDNLLNCCSGSNVLLVLDAAVNVDGNTFAENSSFDEVLFDLADQLNDTNSG